MIRLGVIGCGNRIQSVLDQIDRLNMGAKLVAVTDVRNDELRRELPQRSFAAKQIKYFSDPDEMMDAVKLDGVLVGTRCSLHATMAIKVLRHDIPLYLEKPIATNFTDLCKLREMGLQYSSRVVVSFPLRMSPLVQQVKNIIDSGKLSSIEHVQAWNNVPYGWRYFQDWYRDENETGGMFLQKATHDFDYLNYLLGLRPIRICAMKSNRVFVGNKPKGLRCNDCKEQQECPESPFNMFFMRNETKRVKPNKKLCGFTSDTGNEDSGSALIEYETGMHVAYSQNFIVRGAAGARGARLIGYKGTVEFDWYKDQVTVFMHHVSQVETYKFQTATLSHSGGDIVLAKNFIEVVRGGAESVSPLDAGLISALMCLKAKESAEKHVFKEINWD